MELSHVHGFPVPKGEEESQYLAPERWILRSAPTLREAVATLAKERGEGAHIVYGALVLGTGKATSYDGVPVVQDHEATLGLPTALYPHGRPICVERFRAEVGKNAQKRY